MNENFILKRPKPRIKNSGKGEVIRITDEAYAILAGFSAESGKSMNWTILNKVDRKIKKAIQIGQVTKGY